jgi:hypothetical protein
VAILVLGFAAPVFATTTIPTKLTFVEGIAQQVDCTVVNGFCGTGEVVPFGQATETIEFGSGCSGACDLRTIDLANGSLVLDETFTFGYEAHVPSGKGPFKGILVDVVVGGTGAFTGSTGTLVGTVQGAGQSTTIMLTGSITFAG